MKEIDLCFALNGPHLETMLPIIMQTMGCHNRLDGVNLHFVDKGCSSAVREWLVRSYQCTWHSPENKAPECGRSDGDTVRDVHQTMQWMVDHCGRSEWVFLSHFDIEYKGPMLDHYRNLIASDVGQIGAHATGLVGYSRSALLRSDVGFASVSGCYLIKETDTGFPLWKLRHSEDPRCTDHDIQVSGWDVGELLEIQLSCNHDRVISETETALQRFRIHNGSGCGRCLNANALILDRSRETLARLGLGAIS